MPAFDMSEARLKTIKKLQEENKKLQEENKKLTKQLDRQKKKTQEWEMEYHDTQFLAEGFEEDKKHLEKENDNLKEENKTQKNKHIQSIMKTNSIAKELYREMKYSLGYGEFDEPDRKVMYDDIKKLKEELLYYRFYAYTLDRSGDCDLTKEDVDYFIDDEAKRKTLYDAIGYDEDDQ